MIDESGSVTTAALATYNEIWGEKTYYEGNSSLFSFRSDPAFYRRMEAWLEYWYANTPVTWLRPLQVWSYGAYVNKPGMHGQGRAFDLTRIYASSVDGARKLVFDGRHNVFGENSTWRKRYWATVASVFNYFDYTLTYKYNAQHNNHVHFDNAVSGTGLTSFKTNSRTQVLSVQACCHYVWGIPTTIDGIWGSQTSNNSKKVLARIGRSGLITTKANWQAFNQETLKAGAK